MRQRPKPSKPKTKVPVAPKSPKNRGAQVRDLEKRLAEALRDKAEAQEQLHTRDRELVEAREQLTAARAQVSESHDQQTATSEILRGIASSPTDEQPVFETIVASALRLLNGHSAGLRTLHGNELHSGAFTSTTPSGDSALAQGPIAVVLVSSSAHVTRVVKDRTPSVIEDTETDSGLPPGYRQVARARGFRSGLAVPLLRGETVLGLINVTRRAPGPFSADDIALLQTFADQAVIAIENVRLFKELQASNSELKTALDKQTATSDILRVISQSQTDAGPVFEAIVDSAVRLLRAYTGTLTRVVGEQIVLEAFTRTDAAGDTALQGRFPLPVVSDSSHALTLRDRAPLNVADADADPRLSVWAHRYARVRGYRSQLVVPLLRQADAIGTISVTRRERGGFEADEIALIQTFADQAVIAIENARLFKELQTSNRDLTTALEQQTATSEILRVISQSPSDVRPVFDTILRSAVRLCDGFYSALFLVEGQMLHLRASHNIPSQGLEEMNRVYPISVRDGSTGSTRAVRDCCVVHILDVQEDPDIPEGTRKRARAIGQRTWLGLPMLCEGSAIGTIAVSRSEVKPFSEREVALLQTFADQAVIAIENVRLFTELEARNRDLTATSEILQVISRSPTEVQPVFTAIAKSAAHLIGAVMASVYEFDGALIHLRVVAPDDWPHADDLRRNFPTPPARNFAAGRVILDRAVLHRADLQNDPDTPELTQALAGRMRLRGVLWVPMLRDGEPVGVIGVAREESALFSDEQVRLLQTFADQAVIAIENVRLFNELQASNRDLTTALDKQTATSDILRIISRSQTDVQPVFDAILSSAIRLMGAYAGVLTRVTGDSLDLAAFKSTDNAGESTVRAAFPLSLQSEGSHAKAVRDRTPVNIAEAQTDAQLPEAGRSIARAVGYQSMVVVPVLRHNVAVGTISAVRREPGAFSDDEIALLRTFADQAVIAIENVRLFTELEARNRELSSALDRQTATADVLRIIAQSPTELQPVLDAIAASAVRLCAASDVVIERLEGDHFYNAAHAGTQMKGLVGLPLPLTRGFPGGRAVLDRKRVVVDDFRLVESEFPDTRELNKLNTIRSLAEIPLLSEGRPLGSLAVLRGEVRPFTDVEINLLQTFADQAVIAIENVRLFHEIEAKSQQLEVASQHKSEFLANMSHELRTPLNAIIGFSEVLTERMFGDLNEKQEEYLKDINASGTHLLSLTTTSSTCRRSRPGGWSWS